MLAYQLNRLLPSHPSTVLQRKSMNVATMWRHFLSSSTQ
ncbi:hypothetical protein T11_2691 [Trichinella zimbabwensis]|uniref:Uncharacterized protein n=1 Tax=Trichinella zimbabwensis TaxID=268475 RepID=A0A0V1GMM7_9BILA|nr:hypothetical protein T11_2691 [Trichinella zimbabwensis]